MNNVTLALITSYLDARQMKREWRQPTTKLMWFDLLRKYSFNISPCTRQLP